MTVSNAAQFFNVPTKAAPEMKKGIQAFFAAPCEAPNILIDSLNSFAMQRMWVLSPPSSIPSMPALALALDPFFFV